MDCPTLFRADDKQLVVFLERVPVAQAAQKAELRSCLTRLLAELK